MKKVINIPRAITLNRQKLDRIARDLKRVSKEQPDITKYYMDLSYVIDDIANISKVLQDFEEYLDVLNAGGV